MSEVIVTVTLIGYNSRVPDDAMDSHLQNIAADIKSYAEGLESESSNRKLSLAWEEDEDANLSINADIN